MDPDKGYRDHFLWIPKSRVPNLTPIKQSMSFQEPGGSVVEAWNDAGDHLVVPREFFPYEEWGALPFEIEDITEDTFPRIRKVNTTYELRDSIQKAGYVALVEGGSGILSLACGRGKAQPLTAPIATPEGWRTMGDIQTGDFVVGVDGTPTEVLGVYPQGLMAIYAVEFDDGAVVECTEDHLWETQTPGDRRKGLSGQVRTTAEIRDTLRTRAGAQHSIPRCSPVEYAGEAPPLPWLMGYFLGSSGMRPSTRSIPNSKNIETTVCGENKLWAELKDLGLLGKRSFEKYIPERYLRAPIHAREELLRGLMDSGGHRKPVGYEYSTSSAALAEGILDLVEGLGGRAKASSEIPTYAHKDERRTDREPFRIQIHLRGDERSRYRRRYIRGVRLIGRQEAQCIRVNSGDSLYLTSRHVATHNTCVSLHAWASARVPALVVLNQLDLMYQWKEEILLHTDITEEEIGWVQGDRMEWEKPITLASIATLAKRMKQGRLPPGMTEHFGVAIYDECHILGAPTFNTTAAFTSGNRWGLSATHERSDGKDPLYKAHLGPVLYQNLEQDLEPACYFIYTNTRVPKKKMTWIRAGGDTVNFARLCTYLAGVDARNDLICAYIDQALGEGRKILFLTRLVDHIELLYARYKERAGRLHAGVKARHRQSELHDHDIVFATPNIARQALNRKELDTVMLGLPVQDRGWAQQILGRMLRVLPGKKQPVLVAFEDQLVHTCLKQCARLRSHLTAFGYNYDLVKN